MNRNASGEQSISLNDAPIPEDDVVDFDIDFDETISPEFEESMMDGTLGESNTVEGGNSIFDSIMSSIGLGTASAATVATADATSSIASAKAPTVTPASVKATPFTIDDMEGPSPFESMNETVNVGLQQTEGTDIISSVSNVIFYILIGLVGLWLLTNVLLMIEPTRASVSSILQSLGINASYFFYNVTTNVSTGAQEVIDDTADAAKGAVQTAEDLVKSGVDILDERKGDEDVREKERRSQEEYEQEMSGREEFALLGNGTVPASLYDEGSLATNAFDLSSSKSCLTTNVFSSKDFELNPAIRM